MRNLNKAIRIAKKENTDYKEKIEGMLEAYRTIPHPSTSKSPYELMFGRKINLNIFPTMKRRVKDEGIRNCDKKYKEKAKKYYDGKKNAKKSSIRLGDLVLMKDRRTDRLRPEVGIVIGTTCISFLCDLKMEESIQEINHTLKLLIKLQFHPVRENQKNRIDTKNRNDTSYITKSGREIKLGIQG